MSVPLKIEVQGGNELRKTLRALGDDDLKRELSEAGKAAAEIVADRARQRVPVLTGTLRDVIRAGGTQRGGYVSFGKKKVLYAGVIHFGSPSRNIRANQYVYDAVDDVQRQAFDEYERRVQALIRKISD